MMSLVQELLGSGWFWLVQKFSVQVQVQVGSVPGIMAHFGRF